MQIPKFDRVSEWETGLFDVHEFRYYKNQKLVYVLKFCKSLYEARRQELTGQATAQLLADLKAGKFDPTICGIK